MVKRLSEMPEVEANHLRRIECPTYEDTPPLAGKPLVERRVAIISTAGLHRRSDRAFRPGDGSYRVIPGETPADELVMSHISVNFDRTGFQQDLNVVFPIDRLRELSADGAVLGVCIDASETAGKPAARAARQLRSPARRRRRMIA
jgi:D-proline reductase (dithiol) PrdB